jgi:peroxiredoxin (alkyl hydroperoxide reductase subunit C)
MSALAEQHGRFDKMGAELLTVSCDTQFTHLAWKHNEGELENVKYKMGADPTGKLARMFGIYLDDAGVALRGTFIISPEGTLMNAEVNFLNMGRNIDELMRKFKANIYLTRKPKEACPSKWKDDGDATLTPSAKMVGKVHEALRS